MSGKPIFQSNQNRQFYIQVGHCVCDFLFIYLFIYLFLETKLAIFTKKREREREKERERERDVTELEPNWISLELSTYLLYKCPNT